MTRREMAAVVTRYTQWDGTQRLKLDADKVFEKLAEYLSYTDDVRQAMDWMMRQGMDFDGVKVMGLEEFIEQLRQEMRQRYRDFNLKNALSEMEQKLEDILNRERATLESLQGTEAGRRGKAARAVADAAAVVGGDAQAREPRVRGRAGEGRLRPAARGIRKYSRPRKFSRSQSAHVPRSEEPRLRGRARVDARDGADAPARAGPDVGQLRHHLDGRPAADPGAAGEQGFSESQAGDGAADAVGLHGAEGRPFSALAQGRAANRATGAARHLPEPAEGSIGRARDRPSRRHRDASRADQAVRVRRSAESEPGRDAEACAGAQGRRSARAAARKISRFTKTITPARRRRCCASTCRGR